MGEIENRSLCENVNVKGNGYISHYEKKESKRYNRLQAIKNPKTTEYCVRLEPATFA